jgi:uncharacterized repeat protein (TIGR01451 family)
MYRKMLSYPIITALFLVLIGLDVAARPQTYEPLEAKLVVHKVVVDNRGRERLRSAAEAKPNDVLEYQVTYRNKSRSTVSNVIATLPIPVGMQYVDASAYPRQVEASIDGKEFLPVPLLRDKSTGKLIAPDAPRSVKARGEPVPLVEYRTLRWRLSSIRPRKSAVIRARTSLISATTTTE